MSFPFRCLFVLVLEILGLTNKLERGEGTLQTGGKRVLFGESRREKGNLRPVNQPSLFR